RPYSAFLKIMRRRDVKSDETIGSVARDVRRRVTRRPQKKPRKQCRLYDFTKRRTASGGRNAILPCAARNKRKRRRPRNRPRTTVQCRSSFSRMTRFGTQMRRARRREGRRSKD